MKVEIWSDVVCPWCYIGKRRFESALALFAHRDAVEITWRSFQLDAAAPQQSNETMADLLSQKYNISHDHALASIAHVTATAAREGLEYHLDEAKHGNTLDAHRLIHLATKHGLQGSAKERFMRAYFTERRAIGDRETLLELISEVGIDVDEARAVLEDNIYADDVRIEQETANDLGVRGVPFFVVDRRYGVSGAQPTDVLLDVLQQAWDESSSFHSHDHDGDGDGDGDGETGTCDDGSCDV